MLRSGYDRQSSDIVNVKIGRTAKRETWRKYEDEGEGDLEEGKKGHNSRTKGNGNTDSRHGSV